MRRDVSARLLFHAEGPTQLALAIGVAEQYGADETLEIRQGGAMVPFEVFAEPHGGRLHVAELAEGAVEVSYTASVHGTVAPLLSDPLEELRYTRPSRYAESDALEPFARDHFRGLSGVELLDAVSSWVGSRLSYISGSSLPTDGAVQTLQSRTGVCRDYAHLVVGLLRALEMPARVVSVYAPGLSPMDFHAVAEAAIDGTWHVVDSTALAPRSSLIRIATGRDAADVAFMTTHRSPVTLDEIEVTAVVDVLPDDDVRKLAVIQ